MSSSASTAPGDLSSVQVAPARSWSEFLSGSRRIRLAIVVLLLLLVYENTLRHVIVMRWINEGDWSHGFLIPIFSLYFLATRREALFRLRPTPCYWGAAILALSLAVFFYCGWILHMGYPQGLSIIGAIFGVTLLLGGWGTIRIAWFPIMFLLLAIPLPNRLFVAMTLPLRQLASTVAAAVMPLFAAGLHTEAQAVVIDYVMPGMPPSSLNVEEACSGMRSAMAFVTLGVAMAYLGERPLWQRLLMLSTCVPIAVLCNTIRVIISGLLVVHGYPEWSTGTPHQVLGMLMFGVALALYALIGYLLSHLFVDEPGSGAQSVGT